MKYEFRGKKFDGEDAIEYLDLDVRVFNGLKRDGAVTVRDAYIRVNNSDVMMRIAQRAIPEAKEYFEYDSETRGFLPSRKLHQVVDRLYDVIRGFVELSQCLIRKSS